MLITRQKSFSLLELMITVVLIGTFLTLAVPNYVRMQKRTIERTAATNLNAIRTAMEQYKVVNGIYHNGNMNNIAAINAGLGTFIVQDSMTYQCTSSPTDYECRATSSDGVWSLHVEYNDFPLSHCDPVGTPCPTCTIGGWQCPWNL